MFLSVEEVEAVTGESGLETEVASLPGSPRTCLIAFYRPNHDGGFFLTAELYGSSEAAQERYQGFDPVPWEKLLEESPGATRQEGVVGPESLLLLGVDPTYVPIILVLRHD